MQINCKRYSIIPVIYCTMKAPSYLCIIHSILLLGRKSCIVHLHGVVQLRIAWQGGHTIKINKYYLLSFCSWVPEKDSIEPGWGGVEHSRLLKSINYSNLIRGSVSLSFSAHILAAKNKQSLPPGQSIILLNTAKSLSTYRSIDCLNECGYLSGVIWIPAVEKGQQAIIIILLGFDSVGCCLVCAVVVVVATNLNSTLLGRDSVE